MFLTNSKSDSGYLTKSPWIVVFLADLFYYAVDWLKHRIYYLKIKVLMVKIFFKKKKDYRDCKKSKNLV